MCGSSMCARCGARGHRDLICPSPNSVCHDFIFYGRMARACVTAQPTVVYAPNYYSTPQDGSPAPQQPRVESTAARSATSYSKDALWSCRCEPPPDELGNSEEPLVASVQQQDCPEVVDLIVAVSDVVGLGYAEPEVVELGVAVSEVRNSVQKGGQRNLSTGETHMGEAGTEWLGKWIWLGLGGVWRRIGRHGE